MKASLTQSVRKISAAGLLAVTAITSAACTSSGANHLGAPLWLPARAIVSGIENSRYNARREHLKDHLITYHQQIKQEARQGFGPALQTAYERARIAPARQSELIMQLRLNPDLYFSDDIEPLVVAFMVHGS